jgi:SAM-dependent methyltransferase
VAYLLDKEAKEALRRLELLARIEDPGSIACLERIGVRKGSSCLEVGAGAGSVARWLCDRVGPTGRVVATDLDTRFLEPLGSQVLEVRRHDVVSDALERDAFDLVHARHVLVHVPEREAVLEKLVDAIKPGGWVLLEEIDRTTDAPDPMAPESMKALYDKVVGEIYDFVSEKGLDPTFGAGLFGRLRRLGLTDLEGEGRAHVYRGNPREDVSPHVVAFVELKDFIVARGNVAPAEFDDFIALTHNPDFAWREGLTMAAWGRKPSVRG